MILKQDLIQRSGFSVSGVEKRLATRNIKPIFKGMINGKKQVGYEDSVLELIKLPVTAAQREARFPKRYYRVLVELGDYWQVIAAGKTKEEAKAIANNYEGARIKACWRKNKR